MTRSSLPLRMALIATFCAVGLPALARASEAAAKVVVARAPAPGQQAVLDASEVQLTARRSGLDWDNASGLHHIIVSVGPSGSAAAFRAGRPHNPAQRRAQQTLVYARNIGAGEILSAADLEWSGDAVPTFDSLGDPDLAVGKSARRPLRAGAAAEIRDREQRATTMQRRYE